MVVVTPTHAPDLELFADLHESVLGCFPSAVRHLVVANDDDVPVFRRFEGPRCDVVGVGDVLPRSIWALPFSRLWVNLRWPVPPLRGWIVQQLVKLAVASQVPEQVIVLADSDLVFVRPVSVATFSTGGRVHLYRKDGGVDLSLPRHMRWHAVARDLLGLPEPARPTPLPDYISSLNSWDAAAVKEALRRVEFVTGRPWAVAVGRELHFSEWTLYGLHADEVERAARVVLTADSLCHSYWDPVPLTAAGADAFLSGLRPQDVAYMISAKSNTPLAVRRAAGARLGFQKGRADQVREADPAASGQRAVPIAAGPTIETHSELA
jgi:hypothetical protein